MQTEHTPLLSIIVPIYNVEEYLPECLNSIFAQTFTDYELILVDDGSPDNCPKMCDEAAAKDARVRVIHQKNGGLSAARNAGLDIARGEWIGFIDSDDYVAPEFYNVMLESAQKAEADMALCGIQKVSETGKPLMQQMPTMKGTVTGTEVLKGVARGVYLVAFNKVYRRRIFQGLRYPVGKLYEDTFIVADVYARAKRVACLNRALYDYRQRSTGIMLSARKLRDYDAVEAAEALIDRLLEMRLMDAVPASEKMMFTSLRNVYYHLPPEQRRDPRTKDAKRRHWATLRKMRTHHCLPVKTAVRSAAFHLAPALCRRWWADCR